jgi:hypothetical protein
MLDIVVHRRELKKTLARCLKFLLDERGNHPRRHPDYDEIDPARSEQAKDLNWSRGSHCWLGSRPGSS